MPNHVAAISYIEDEEVNVPKPISAKRITGARTTKKRQPAAQRQQKFDTQGSSSSVVNQPVLKGPHFSASSSSSNEDEFAVIELKEPLLEY